MGQQLFTNNAKTTLSGTLAQGGTTLVCTAGGGNALPTITGSDYFRLTIFTKDVGGVEINQEVVKATARTGDSVTIERDIESITGQAGGYAYNGTTETVYIELRLTAGTMDNMLQTGDIGGAVQAHDATLDALAAVTTAANKLVYATGADTFATTDLTAAGRALLDDADAAAQRTTLGLGNSATLAVGTTAGTVAAGDHNHATVYQPLDGDLTAIAGLTSAANKLPYFTGAETAALADLSAFGRSLIDDADAAAGRATLSAAPLAAKYIVQTPDSELSGEQALSALATGLLKNTTTTGVLSIATVRTDYAEPTTALATGLLKNTTTTGEHSIATAGTDYSAPGTAETTSAARTFSSSITETPVVANTTTAYTVTDRSMHDLTLTGNCTFTFPSAAAGKEFTMTLNQDATGSRTVTWPASVRWPSGSAPVITATASKTDVISFVSDGTYWLGFLAGQVFTRA